ncbi:hypothetical protein BKA61DRAFT_653369 [Leptodontidium sp. MPI-SDFR-AT-0119]|nr:hypothetical protein BKA61DRAFT_653369 [Leptodontidium sp. MPI-SDFR-AT-0119]
MPSKFAWPFKKVLDDEEQQQQALPQQQNQTLPQSLPRPSTKKERNARSPTPIPIPTNTKPHPDPSRIPWTQLTLRIITLLASISALTIAIYVAIGLVSIQRIWPVIFVSSTTTLLLSLLETLALLHPLLPIPIPRLHPIALIVADLLVVSLSIWSFLVLFLEVRDVRRDGGGGGEGKGDGFGVVEMWIVVGIGFIHALLFIFDCIDCCSAHSPNSRVDELSYRKNRRGTSRVGEDVFEMDWG